MKPVFNNETGLIPAIIQDANTSEVLMLGYMNAEAYNKSLQDNRVCFFSRSKKRLWVKGETSGNYLNLVDIKIDCDNDTLLISVHPEGPVCHTGSETCFGNRSSRGFLYQLEQIINSRIEEDDQSSYTNRIFKEGINRMAQKVGEETVELVIEAMGNNKDLIINEASDLLYHILVLLKSKNIKLSDIETELKNRSLNTG